MKSYFLKGIGTKSSLATAAGQTCCRLIDKINLISDPFMGVIPQALCQANAQQACVRVFVVIGFVIPLGEYCAQLCHHLRVFLVTYPAQVFTDTIGRKVFDDDTNGDFGVLGDLLHLA